MPNSVNNKVEDLEERWGLQVYQDEEEAGEELESDELEVEKYEYAMDSDGYELEAKEYEYAIDSEGYELEEEEFEAPLEEIQLEDDDEIIQVEGGELAFSTPLRAIVSGEYDEVLGMVFPSLMALDQYLMAYAKQKGFTFVRASGAHDKDGKNRCNTMWTCECYGQPRKRKKKNDPKMATDSIISKEVNIVKRKSKKCGCLVKLYGGVTEGGEWDIM